MTIPFFQLLLKQECAFVVADQILSGFIGPGNKVGLFANAIAETAGAKNCILTTSGTAALSLAAIAVGLHRDDIVLVPAYGVVSVPNAFMSIGARPMFVDIDRATGCMGVSHFTVRKLRESRAICYVHFSGVIVDEALSILDICLDSTRPLIEDAACALGHHLLSDRAGGGIGDIAIFSFSPHKNVTTGQGGAVVTNDSELAEAVATIVDQGGSGWREGQPITKSGSNLRMTDMQAVLGLAQMKDLLDIMATRLFSHRAMQEILGDKLFTVDAAYAPLHNIVFTPERKKLIGFLAEKGIEARRQYTAYNRNPLWAYDQGQYPNAYWWNDNAVYLPFGLGLTPEQAGEVGRAVKESGVELWECGE